VARYVKWFHEIGIDDTQKVGGKNASLGEMYRHLTAEGVRIPNGFAVTAEAYRLFLQSNGLETQLKEILDGLDYEEVAALRRAGSACRAKIQTAEIPAQVTEEILEGYARLREEYGDALSLAVRSSATAEDSPEASFAGQNETYLNIRGEEALLDAYDLAASGVMFSLDTETGFRDVIFINASLGLGENIVQGSVDPDLFYLHKPTFEKGFRAVLKRRLGGKELKMVFASGEGSAGETTRNIPTTEAERRHFCLSDEEVMTLGEYALRVERHYSRRAGRPMAMDMEWAKDGIDGEIYLVQARPETVESRHEGSLEIYHLKEKGKLLLKGQAVGRKIAAGRVRILRDLSEMESFRPGEVLVTRMTTPDWEPVMKIAAAVVTDRGGRTCHAAIVSRELGLPAVVGAGTATAVLHDGMEVTVSCAEGETGFVYEGTLGYEVARIDPEKLPRTRTGIMMNLGNPNLAFSLAHLPVDGIGLARMEFIISEYIKAHPMALLHPEKTDTQTRKALRKLTEAYAGKREFFVTTLSEGVATIASAVYPRPCVVRMSDFKSNEYASLLGGRFFEPVEENPMLGFRGASRYSHPDYEEGFALECEAMKRVREEMGFANVILMIPFCRRVGEARRVLETMERHGLRRGENGLRIYMMCEIPNNILQIDAFSEYFDGFSIGSNDLTQLVLGVDRDSELVAFDYDERDPGVLRMISAAIEGARRNGRHIGICGQAPSDYPEIAEFLVREGIETMSLNPDSVLQTLRRVAELEAENSPPPPKNDGDAL